MDRCRLCAQYENEMLKQQNSKFLLVISIVTFITFSKTVYSQRFDRTHLEGHWCIIKIEKLQNTQGVISKSFLKELDQYQKKMAVSKSRLLKINKDYLLVDKKTSKITGWPDSIILYSDFLYERMDDNVLTTRYSGDELTDTSAKRIGNSFMKLIGSSDSKLRVVFCSKNEQTFMVCIVNRNEIAIYAVDQNILMTCRKTTGKFSQHK